MEEPATVAARVPGAPQALVTGVAGFIGSHLAERLMTEGWQVRGVDAFTDAYDPARKRANLRWLQTRCQFELVEADLAVDDLRPLVRGADVVLHLAAEPGVPGSWGPAFAAYCQRNVLATQRLLEAAAAGGAHRVVYASSSSVYGDDAASPVVEDRLPRPASPYGVSKLAGELLVGAYARRGLLGVSLRFFSIYGPRQRPDMAIHRFIEAALAGRPLTLYGSGAQTRDFTFVDDAVAATAAAATADLEPGAVLNVAAGAPVSLSTVVHLLGEELGPGGLAVRRGPERPGDVAWTWGATDRARDRLGWTAATDLRSGLARQIAWHRGRARAGQAAPACTRTVP